MFGVPANNGVVEGRVLNRPMRPPLANNGKPLGTTFLPKKKKKKITRRERELRVFPLPTSQLPP